MKALFDKLTSIEYTKVENNADYYCKKTDHTLELYFEWSKGTMDWIHNFNFCPISRHPRDIIKYIKSRAQFCCKLIKESFKNRKFIKPYKDMPDIWYCHRGFLKVWKSIEPYVVDAIMDPDVYHIKVAGYSHGAAIAALCYEYCNFHRPDIVVSGWGYGCPRVVWGPCPHKVKNRFAEFVILKNGKDLITHLPPVIFGFHHEGILYKFGKSEGCIKDHLEYWYKKYLAEDANKWKR